VHWAVDVTPLQGSGFHLPVTSGTLEPRECATLQLEFAPDRPMGVDVSLPIHLDGAEKEAGSKPYLTVQVRTVESGIWLKGDFGLTPGALLGPK